MFIDPFEPLGYLDIDKIPYNTQGNMNTVVEFYSVAGEIQ